MGFWEPLLFWIFAFGAIVTSCAVIFVRNPLYCALALITDFFFFAGLYVLLSAHFLAVVQVLVYGGAIMVLFLFIIMLLNLRDDDTSPEFSLHHIAGVLSGIALFMFLGVTIMAVTNDEAVEAVRAEATAQLEANEGEDVTILIHTPSHIPGLYADLNEAALETGYGRLIEGYQAGMLTPAHEKYRPYDPTQPFEIPPVLLPRDPALGTVPQTGSNFGTFQPISILLVNRFVIPFELTAILLLAAIVGAMIIAKRRVVG